MSLSGPLPAVAPFLAPLVRVEGVTKSFGGVRALRGVNLEVLPGEVHALLGENGAGKSTLIKILSGVHTYDGGSIEIAGNKVAFDTPAKSRQAGVAVVYQELSLVESLSVAANLMLGREPRTRFGFLKKRQLLAEVDLFLKQQGIPLEPRAPVSALPFAYRQMTEICKALLGEVRLLILDEPTSALTSDEEGILFDAIRTVTRRGVGVIYVTHRLNEVFRISQRVTVLRDGSNVGTFATADTDMQRLVAVIIGPRHHAIEAPESKLSAAAPSQLCFLETRPAVLRLEKISNDRMREVDLTLLEGEIHGLAGLTGSGRTEILQTIFGLRRIERGDLIINGEKRRLASPFEAIDAGIALVPEDRQVQGLILEHSIERNLILPRLLQLSRWGWVQQRASMQEAEAAIGKLLVKAPGPSTPVKNLSGGNQQKVVFAKWSNSRTRILLLDEPTVGVDVGAREEIYALIREAASAGAATLVVSSDLVELLALCDRISVVVDGRVVKTCRREEAGDAEELHRWLQLSQTADGQAA
jgi:ribose transport system ATP-binding protein